MFFRKKNSDFKICDLSNTLLAERKSLTDVRIFQPNSWNKWCESTETNALPQQTKYVNPINTPVWPDFYWTCDFEAHLSLNKIAEGK